MKPTSLISKLGPFGLSLVLAALAASGGSQAFAASGSKAFAIDLMPAALAPAGELAPLADAPKATAQDYAAVAEFDAIADVTVNGAKELRQDNSVSAFTAERWAVASLDTANNALGDRAEATAAVAPAWEARIAGRNAIDEAAEGDVAEVQQSTLPSAVATAQPLDAAPASADGKFANKSEVTASLAHNAQAILAGLNANVRTAANEAVKAPKDALSLASRAARVQEMTLASYADKSVADSTGTVAAGVPIEAMQIARLAKKVANGPA